MPRNFTEKCYLIYHVCIRIIALLVCLGGSVIIGIGMLSIFILPMLFTFSICDLVNGCNLNIAGSCTHYEKISGFVSNVAEFVNEEGRHYMVYYVTNSFNNGTCTVTKPPIDPHWHRLQPVDALVDITYRDNCITLDDGYNRWKSGSIRLIVSIIGMLLLCVLFCMFGIYETSINTWIDRQETKFDEWLHTMPHRPIYTSVPQHDTDIELRA
jgi:hypothetical protein